MRDKQRTIKQAVSLSGTGLHTGQETIITFNPAPENYGIRFVRTDIEEPIEIEALTDNVVDLSRGTTLGKNGYRVHTVEHVLASLVGLQIDNCRIELSGIEPPVGDGSSLSYVEVLLQAGFEEQNADREFFVIDETVRYTNEAKGTDIVALPTDDYRITVMIDYHNPALGSQHTGMFDLEKEFVNEFSSARTFCFLTEVESLIEQGLIKGGNLNNAICIVDKILTDEERNKLSEIFGIENSALMGNSGILNNTELRFKNEPARHKLLDMLGDLSLIGVPIKAQILAARPGHQSNFEFAKKIRSLYLKNKAIQKLQPKKVDGMVFDINTLLKVMPHRYPFLLVDRVIEYDHEKGTITGLKNVTMNEPHFTGHFPDYPVMPGVLIVESMAQTACILLLQALDNFEKYWVFFRRINNVKFRRQVIPGDQLIIKMEMLNKKLGTVAFKGVAYVNNQIVTEAEIYAAIVEKES